MGGRKRVSACIAKLPFANYCEATKAGKISRLEGDGTCLGFHFFFLDPIRVGLLSGSIFFYAIFFLICLFLEIAWGKRIFSPRPPIKNGRPGTVPICRNSKSGVGFGCSNRPANRQRQTDQTHPTNQPCFPFSSLLSMSLRQSFEF